MAAISVSNIQDSSSKNSFLSRSPSAFALNQSDRTASSRIFLVAFEALDAATQGEIVLVERNAHVLERGRDVELRPHGGLGRL